MADKTKVSEVKLRADGREFAHTWFLEGVAPIWQEYLKPRWATIVSYLEIGVCEGQSLLWVIENLLGPGQLAVGVDPYIAHRRWLAAEYAEHKRRCLSNLAAFYGYPGEPGSKLAIQESKHYFERDDKPFCDLHFQTSKDFFATECGSKFDFIYVDGDHAAHACLEDMVFGWQRLNDRGIMVVDDLTRRWFRGHPQVKEAVDAFLIGYEKRYKILFREENQIAFIKEAW